MFKARGQNSHEGHKGPERPQGAKKGTCHNSHKGLKGSKVAYMFTVRATGGLTKEERGRRIISQKISDSSHLV